MAKDKADKDITTIERWRQLKEDRLSWELEWKDVTKYVFPRRSVFEDSKGKAETVGTHVYDGTALAANNLLANGLMGYFVSSSYPWFRARLPWPEANDLQGVREWLDYAERVIYDDFQRSNFYEETTEVFKDAGAIGNACLYVDEDDLGAPFFRALHPKEFYIDVDEYGRVVTVYRRFFATVRQLTNFFGYENLSKATQSLADSDAWNEKIETLHACEPRGARDAKSPAAKDKRWLSEYWELGNEHRLSEGGYDRFPYMVLRWATNSDEAYGRGPGNDALIDIKRANQMQRDLLDVAHRAADPPLNVPEDMRNKVRNVPGGLNFYQTPDMIVQPWQSTAQYPIALDREQHVRERIEDHFMVDFFLMLQRAPKQMTATEVMERQAEKAAVLGTIIGRIASDFLDPVIDLMFYKAVRGGRVPPPPPRLLEWMQANRLHRAALKIEYIGPLAQAQKKFHVTQGILQSLQATLPYVQFKPEILDLYNWDDIVREINEAQGMPARLLREPQEVAMLRQARQQAQAEAARMQQEAAGAEAYGKLKDAPESGSPVASIGDMLRQSIGAGSAPG